MTDGWEGMRLGPGAGSWVTGEAAAEGLVVGEDRPLGHLTAVLAQPGGGVED